MDRVACQMPTRGTAGESKPRALILVSVKKRSFSLPRKHRHLEGPRTTHASFINNNFCSHLGRWCYYLLKFLLYIHVYAYICMNICIFCGCVCIYVHTHISYTRICVLVWLCVCFLMSNISMQMY